MRRRNVTMLILGEIDSGMLFEEIENLREGIRSLRKSAKLHLLTIASGFSADIGVPGDGLEFQRNVFSAADYVYAPCDNCAIWHRKVFRRRVGLCEGQAALTFDRPKSEGAIGPGSGENHANGAVFFLLGK